MDQLQQGDAQRLYKTASGRYFTVTSHKFVVIDPITARDIFENHWKQQVSVEEAFGTATEDA